MKIGYSKLTVLLASLMLSAAFVIADDLSTKGNEVKDSKAGAKASSKVSSVEKVKKTKAVKKKKAVQEAKPVEKASYICPMCHIKADKPGKCPECGMDMVKLPKPKEDNEKKN